MKIRKYTVHGEVRDTKEYKEVTVNAISAKEAFEVAREKHPDIKFIGARKQGCSCGA